MPTPDASQYTQFKRYSSVSADECASHGTKISPFNTFYSIPILTGCSIQTFLPSAHKESKFNPIPPVTGPGGVILVEVTTDNSTLTLTFRGLMTIDWGDMVVETYDWNTWSGNSINHAYSVAGTYIINISVPVGAGNITGLTSTNGGISYIDASGCTELTSIFCNGNMNMSSLDVANTKLTNITAIDCNLASISNLVSVKPYLKTLNLSYNPVLTLDVHGFTALTRLVKRGNSLTTLDFSGCSALVTVDITTNSSLTTLDASNLPSLNLLVITGCSSLATLRIDGTLLNAIATIGTNLAPKLNPAITGTVTMSTLQATTYPGNDPATYYATALPNWSFTIV